jgi:hypothetical protein
MSVCVCGSVDLALCGTPTHYFAKKSKSGREELRKVEVNLIGGSSERKMYSNVLTHGSSWLENKLNAVLGVW